MNRKTRYTDERLDMEVVEDFLPPPEKLVLKEDTVKVTIPGLSLLIKSVRISTIFVANRVLSSLSTGKSKISDIDFGDSQYMIFIIRE